MKKLKHLEGWKTNWVKQEDWNATGDVWVRATCESRYGRRILVEERRTRGQRDTEGLGCIIRCKGCKGRGSKAPGDVKE